MSHELTIDIPLQPKQGALLQLVQESQAKWIGYGGALGGSKSHGGRSVMLVRRLEQPGTRGLIFRRKFGMLWENHIQPLFDQFPFTREWYHTGHKELTLPTTPPSVIQFGYAEHPGDIFDYEGGQWMDIFVDQAEQMTEAELVFLKSRNRWPGLPEHACKMMLTFNWGHIGHAFLKRIFIDHKYKENEDPSDYVFLQAYGWDNVEWCRSALATDGVEAEDFYSWSEEQRFEYFITRSQYGRDLDRLPGAMRASRLLGRYDQFAGQYFDIFDPAKHTERPERMGLQDWHPRWISADWGFAHNSAVHWHARNGKQTQTYRELVRNNLSPRALAMEIVERTKREKISDFFLSPDAFAKRTTEASIAEQMGEVLVAHGLPYPVRADDDRVGGWMLMYEELGSGEWVIGTNCEDLLDKLPMLTRDDTDTEDCLKFEGDDSCDSARYGLKSKLRPGNRPLEQRVLEHVTSDDPSIQAIQHQIAMHKERLATPGPVKMRRPWMANRWNRRVN